MQTQLSPEFKNTADGQAAEAILRKGKKNYCLVKVE